MKKYLVLLVLAVLSPMSFSYDGWSGQHVISSVRTYSSAIVLIQMVGAENPGGCNTTSYLALQDANTEHGKRLYSAILTAYTAGKEVQLALTGCSGSDKSGYPIIEQVWLK